MAYDPEQDHRLDPRAVGTLKALADSMPVPEPVNNRQQLLSEASSPDGIAKDAALKAAFDSMDDETLSPRDGLLIEVHQVVSMPDNNHINVQVIRPDTEERLPCIYYIHGGGMQMLSCFYGNYQAWARLLARQGLCVVMVDFRNCVSPSSVPEVAPYPAGLNDCVSGFHWVYQQYDALNIDRDKVLIAGESGGGNLAIATTMKLIRDGHRDRIRGVYALCPFIAGKYPVPDFPSSKENDGIFINIAGDNAAIAYGIEAYDARDPLAWPIFASEADVQDFPPTMINVNECDPLLDEGIAFFRLLLRAGVKAHCRQLMGTFHAADMFMLPILPDHARRTASDIASWLQECGC